MSKDLHTRLQSLRSTERRITPDAVWVRATRATLLMQVGNTLPTSRVSRTQRAREIVRHFFTVNVNGLIRKPLMAALSTFIVLTGGSIMSVSAAERSLPGDFLYSLKLATEQARLAWVSSKEEKLKLKTEFTGRRVTELKAVALTEKNDERVKQVTEILKSDLNTLKEQLGDMKKDATSANAVVAAKLVDQKTNEVIAALQETKTNMSPETKAKMTEAQSVAADTGVKAIEVLVEKHQESNDIVPVADVAEAIQNHANTLAGVSQGPLELVLGSATATPASVVTLVQSYATSTTASASSSLELPNLMDQMKDMTTQVFVQQKEIDQKAVTNAASSSSAASAPTVTSTAPTASSSPPTP